MLLVFVDGSAVPKSTMSLKRLLYKNSFLFQNVRLMATFKGRKRIQRVPPTIEEKTCRPVPLSVEYMIQQDNEQFGEFKDPSNDSLAQINAEIEFLKEKLAIEKQKVSLSLAEEKRIREASKGPVEDPSYPPTNVPCGGCGAHLHCNDIRMPGFISKSSLEGKTEADLLSQRCYRCRLIWFKEKLIETDIDKAVYKNVVKRLKNDHALIVMIVDLTDIGNSIIPDYLNIVGQKRPIYIVGNKIDLFPRDQKDYLNHIGNRLLNECYRANLNPRKNNIRHACLVSAKTGYGIEELINKLIKDWEKKGNVYLVGSANSGKSTLYNRFLSSDYCMPSCRDMVMRSTVCKWPGTTIDVIGFPISNLNSYQLMLRTKRLIDTREADKLKREKFDGRLKTYGKSRNAVLFGTVKKTDFRSEEQEMEESKKFMPSGQHFVDFTVGPEGDLIKTDGIDQSSFYHKPQLMTREMYPDSRWTYDTPGLINKNQIINWMTMEELSLFVNSVHIMRPRVFVLMPGDVMFVTGLARIDYLEGSNNILFTVHIFHNLPIHVVKAKEADQFYLDNVGTSTLAIPIGGQDRLDWLPSLVGREFTIQTKDQIVASADLQLSTLGWVSFAGNNKLVRIRAYMPGGRGMHVRSPALLPHLSAFRGRRIRNTKEYNIRKLKLYK